MSNKDLDTQWEEYKKEFNKQYGPEEDAMRRALWEKTRQKIEKHNKEADEGKHTWWMGINQFTDMRPEEVCCGGLRHCHREEEEEHTDED